MFFFFIQESIINPPLLFPMAGKTTSEETMGQIVASSILNERRQVALAVKLHCIKVFCFLVCLPTAATKW